ncbi:type II secretion system protein M [Demequina sp. NBRC 110053]|uniref:type II secretion system protein M n=1 Tax=Demequina sp. NBRC 110053 TaxID=1570342 RepID=UPI0009FF15AA|nr:type II secretion system protein M [Demequina sp. NBRC 110053]
MKQPVGTAKTWTVATVLVAVVLLIAAWFLLISPVLAAAAETREETAAQEQQNDVTRVQVADLRAEFARMPEYEAQLAALQEQITTTQRYADLQLLIAQVSEEHDVVVTNLEFETAEPVEMPVPEAPATPAPAEGATDEQPAAEPTPAAAAPAEPAGPSLFAINVTMELAGRYSDVLSVVDALQTGEQRILLVTGVDLATSDDTEITTDDPTVAVLEGQVFVLSDIAALEAADDPGAEPGAEPSPEPSVEPSPLPRSEENPLTPKDD